MTRDELLSILDALSGDAGPDTETAHEAADQAILGYINDAEITRAYDAIKKWYA